MLFDDRLATVLRQSAAGESGARTQYRQLLDLLGTSGAVESDALEASALERLDALAERIPAGEQSKILREPGTRLRNPALVEHLAQGEPKAAAAAVATARLGEEEWLTLIPRLPVNARGFLRHRRDLPPRVKALLERLGVQDLVLTTEQEIAPAVSEPVEDAPTENPAPRRKGTDGVHELLQRIESFRQRRAQGKDHPRLPLNDAQGEDAAPAHIDFETGADGRIGWADGDAGASLVGLAFGSRRDSALLQMPEGALRAIGLRQPLVRVPLRAIDIAGMAGEWRVDAAPWFREADGGFLGYRGRIRRADLTTAPSQQSNEPGERMRQVLHELRTPVNAIQGFAEIIQQQVFGHAPNGYRALAAAIGVDAARLLAGFDEVDRLAKLETGAMQPEEGEADLRDILHDTVQRLAGVLRPRSAELRLRASGGPFLIPLDDGEARLLCWRLLATLAGGMAPGEVLELVLAGDGETVTLGCDLPLALSDEDDPFAASIAPQARAITAGMFGSGFTLRLVRAEAAALGGRLQVAGDRLELVLPALTELERLNSEAV